MSLVYELRQKNDNGVNYVYGKFVIDEKTNSSAVFGTVYSCNSWSPETGESFDDNFFAEVYCKHDSCTHWNFNGEEFVPEFDNIDAYYHICGEYCFLNHICLMCFVWKVVADIMDEFHDENYGMEQYFELEKTRKLVEMMLDGYEIVRLED